MEQESLNFAPERRIWRVTELLGQLKRGLERDYFDIWVEGEISNFHQAPSRHCYFTLKDVSGQLKVALFATQARYLKFRPSDGLQVLLRGRLSLYEARGDLQFYAEHMEPLGRGGLQLAFEQLKQKLAEEGLFDASRKRPLPKLPRRIGLITSPAGAVVADMIRVLTRRYPNLEILLYPAAVQGEAAAGEIVAGLDFFAAQAPGSRHAVEVLIVGRGGGSLEDLWPFNEEKVARALARSPLPTIAAVGHETDFTIADFVADLRAPTPSAAAELVIGRKSDFVEAVAGGRRHLLQAMRYRLLRQRGRLDNLTGHRAFPALRHRLGQRAQRADELAHRLEVALRRRWEQAQRRLAVAAARVRHRDVRAGLAAWRGRLAQPAQRLAPGWAAAQQRRRQRLEALTALLRERNPLHLLERGYTLVYDREGRLATSPERFAAGDELRIRFARGWLEAEARRRGD